MNEELKVGDLVVIDKDNPAWDHLNEKEESHPLKLQGVVTEVRVVSYVVKFDKWTAYLKSDDLVKISK
jgi:hypothetical protein